MKPTNPGDEPSDRALPSRLRRMLRASRFARRRGEEERADTFFRPGATMNEAAARRETQRAERAIRHGNRAPPF